MKNLSKILLALVAALLVSLLFVGCKTKTITTTKETKDSSNVAASSKSLKEVNDSTIIKPKAEIRYIVINPCDSNGKLKPINQSSKNGSAKSTIKGKGDTLLIDCDCDEQISRFRSEISTKDSTISSLKTHALMTSETKTIEVEKYKTPFWNWVLIIFLSSLSGYLIIKKILS